eukprot:7381269-Prymnesium_polylepis.1
MRVCLHSQARAPSDSTRPPSCARTSYTGRSRRARQPCWALTSRNSVTPRSSTRGRSGCWRRMSCREWRRSSGDASRREPSPCPCGPAAHCERPPPLLTALAPGRWGPTRTRCAASDAPCPRRLVCSILADEEAKEARARKLNENRALAMAAKRETHDALSQLQAEEEHRMDEARHLVQDVQAARERPVQAMEELQRQNRLKAQELREETERLEAQAAEEKRAEDAKRADLIKQIRALELVPRKRVTALDPTYLPELGLLEQMSLAELREQLAVVEQERAEEVLKRRASIISNKQERETDLSQRVERLTAMRELAASQAATKREATKDAAQQAERKRQERLAEAQLKVHETIEAKRAARRREEAALAEELKAIRIKNQYLGADKQTVERKKWESQQQGAQRDIMRRQQQTHEDARQLAKKNDVAQRDVNHTREEEAHEAFLREYEGHLDEARHESEQEKAQVLARQVCSRVDREGGADARRRWRDRRANRAARESAPHRARIPRSTALFLLNLRACAHRVAGVPANDTWAGPRAEDAPRGYQERMGPSDDWGRVELQRGLAVCCNRRFGRNPTNGPDASG